MSHVLRCTGYDLAGIEIDHASGSRLHTVDGQALVDLESGVWSVALGHNHPRVLDVLCRQSPRISHMGYRLTHRIQEEAAIRILEVLEFPDGACVFLSSGSEAVEFAVQAARHIGERPRLLTFRESFLSSYGSSGEKPPDEWILFDRDLCQDCSMETGCAHDCPYLSSIPFDQVSAFVLEPGSAGGHIRFPPKPLVKTLHALVEQAGGLLIVNEVTTGIGRTGRWFGYNHYSVDPDIAVLGKGLGNGYPVSAVAMRRAVVDQLARAGFRYAQSHQNDPLACAVAAEVLRTVRDEDLVERAAQAGRKLAVRLGNLVQTHDAVRDVRGRGLMQAIEFDLDEEELNGLFVALIERGFLVGYKPAGRLFRLFPPLTIESPILDEFIDALDDLLLSKAYYGSRP